MQILRLNLHLGRQTPLQQQAIPLPTAVPDTEAINHSRLNDHTGALYLGPQTASTLGLLFAFLA
ncbi:hypothetical protein BJ878DRAFT_505391 [Calycina marina]|uniref:Uncharacterized protein n=1 Tax=Calycina marina TaxID=1763456 RepID=A0A9P7Z3F6_9HELO|nr:hypothetical protein BJ878DRAFT_505391 [Calycina marina]